MIARKRRSAEYWKEVLEDFLKSGKSQKEYAQEKKISRVTLLAWSKKLGIPLSGKKQEPS